MESLSKLNMHAILEFSMGFTGDGGATGVLGAPSSSGGGWVKAPVQSARAVAGVRKAPPVSALEQARKAHNEAVRAETKVGPF